MPSKQEYLNIIPLGAGLHNCYAFRVGFYTSLQGWTIYEDAFIWGLWFKNKLAVIKGG